jgi:hypothetical protein
MRHALHDRALPGRRTRCRRALGASLALCAAIAFAQAPTVPAAADPEAEADAALVARASALVYKREVARLRAADVLETDPDLLRQARRVVSAISSQAPAVAPVAAGWRAWGVTGEARDEPMAWCLPNGALMVSYGLLKKMSLTEPELAAILAHVVGHQLAGADVREALATYKRGHDTRDPDVNRAASELADILGKRILSPRHDAAAERQADALAVELLARSGIDPAAAVSAWRKVAQSGSTRPPGLLAFHATPPARIAELEAQAAAARPAYEKALADAAAAPAPPKKPPPKQPARRTPRPPQG